MSEAIVVALITGGLSFAGVVITCLATAKKNETAMKVSQAVTDTKIEELTREVRAHNNFAQRMPVVEEQIKVINHRIEDLEGYHKPTNSGGILMSNKMYDVLKYIAMVVLPAIATLYFALAGIWGFPYGEEIVGTITAIDTFLGVLLGISSAKYNKTNVE